mgnify:CR=1 FL=1
MYQILFRDCQYCLASPALPLLYLVVWSHTEPARCNVDSGPEQRRTRAARLGCVFKATNALFSTEPPTHASSALLMFTYTKKDHTVSIPVHAHSPQAPHCTTLFGYTLSTISSASTMACLTGYIWFQ